MLPAVLSIAGSDSGANAGIQTDLLTFAANGAYGTTAITCLTAQNPNGISKIEVLDPDFVAEQIKQVAAYFPIRAAKTGMLFSAGIIETVAQTVIEMKRSNPLPLVVDPVMVASSGAPLLDQAAETAYRDALLPIADLITPNLDEAKALLDRDIKGRDDIATAAADLAKAYQTHALVKGGHLAGDRLFDVLASPEGSREIFEQERIQSIDTHGSGCTLSAASAAQLALGASPSEAVAKARSYLRAGMENPLNLPNGKFINHLPR